LAESGGVCRCRNEFGAAEVQVALTWSFLRQTQAVPELQLGLEEVRLEPVDGRSGSSACTQLFGGWASEGGAGAEDGLVVSRCRSRMSASSSFARAYMRATRLQNVSA